MNKFRKIFATLTRAERTTAVIALALMCVSSVAITTLAIGTTTKVVPAQGGEYTEGFVGQPAYGNPVLAATDADAAIVRLTFASLATLADKIESDETGRMWKIRLKENLRWTDERKITSDDVIFTIETLQKPETRSPLYSAWQGVSANRVSELEFQIALVAPYAFFRESLENLAIIPKHIFADTPPANWRLSDYLLKPVGSGPYRFSSYATESNGFITQYRLISNPSYVGPHPSIETVIFRFFSSPDDLVAAFNAGAVDGIATLDPELVSRVNRPHQVVAFAVPGYYAVFLNQSQHLALKEPEVRKALSLATDRAAITEAIFNGTGRAITGPLAVSEDRADAETATDPGDLLERTGWKISETGIREKSVKSNPISLEFTLTVPQVPYLVEVATAVKGQWERIGVRLNLIVLSPEDVANRVVKNREYQLLLFGNFLRPADDLLPFWHSNERFHPGLNLALYVNKKADGLMESARREIDSAVRGEKLRELDVIIRDDAPAVFLYAPHYLYILDRSVRGVPAATITDHADRFQDIGEWYTKTTRALK